MFDMDQIDGGWVAERERCCAAGLWDTYDYTAPKPLIGFIESSNKGCAACTMVFTVLEQVQPGWAGTRVTEKEIYFDQNKPGTITVYEGDELAGHFELYRRVEGLALKTIGLPFPAVREKVVPDFSSWLGDPRERAETLHADHRAMCRFSGADCPNYRKVLGCGPRASKFDYTSFVKAVPDAARFLRFPGMQTA
ncbi:hypothetical protein NUW58_g2331 [Xylaria curta]|uniref:Uncharacterized protein n=1 Tax=Xylaria curta TaxID=42375 RepID=A0ACC1PGM5_9PEZI|nr:hypothetical protein NUW58_g2331 [Xylaria curta]